VGLCLLMVEGPADEQVELLLGSASRFGGVGDQRQAITGSQAAPGWDPVSGWGSPNTQALVPLLAHYVSR
jgi:hypothetical protein